MKLLTTALGGVQQNEANYSKAVLKQTSARGTSENNIKNINDENNKITNRVFFLINIHRLE